MDFRLIGAQNLSGVCNHNEGVSFMWVTALNFELEFKIASGLIYI